MDTFIEQIIKKKKTPGEILIITAVVLAVLVLLVVSLFITFLLPFIVFVLWGAWWLITGQNKEYEYSVTNGDIDIDMIIAKRKRKRLVSVTGRKVETLLPYNPQMSTAGFQRVVHVAPSLREAGLWMFTYNSKKNGHTLVVFQPDERVLNALYGGLQKLVQLDTYRAAREQGIVLTGAKRSAHGDLDE